MSNKEIANIAVEVAKIKKDYPELTRQEALEWAKKIFREKEREDNE